MNNKIAFLILFLFSVASDAIAVDYNSVWIGPSQDVWSGSGNWNTPIPNNTLTDTFAVSIDGKPDSGYVVKLDQEATITSLFVGNGDVLEISSGFNLTVNSDITGKGIINTESYSNLYMSSGLIDGITHTGDMFGFLSIRSAVVHNLNNSSGAMEITDSLFNGFVTNNATLVVGGSSSNSFSTSIIDGIGTIESFDETFTATGMDSTLTIAGEQTLTGLMNTAGGQLIVNGLLNADGATGNFSSDVSGTGTINTVNGTTLNVVGVLEGITHTGGTLATADGSSLSVVNGTLRNVTNSSGALVVTNSSLDGLITNNAFMVMSGGSGSFVNATIDGVGNIESVGSTFTATGTGSTLTIAGDQALTGLMNTAGGQLIVNGLLNADGATGNFSSDVSGTGTINTVNGTTLNVVGVLEGITHTGGTLATADGSSLSVVNGTLRNVTNSSGVLGVVDSTFEGQITNQAGATIIAGSGADVIKVGATTRLSNEGLIDGSLTVSDGGILNGSGILSGDLDIFSGGTFLSDNIAWPFNVDGTATLAGELQFDWFELDLNGDPLTPVAGDFIDLLHANTITGEFDLLTLAQLGDGLGWQLDYLTDEIGRFDVARLSVVSAVPVPAAIWLFGSGFIGLIGVARRKKS